MSKTAALRKLVREQMQTVQGETYYRIAPPTATFPYKTFTLTDASFLEDRDDITLDVDIWDQSRDPKTVEEIADQVERLFAAANLPRPPIYPTFYRDARYTLDDPDKTMQHIQLRFLVQLYKEE